MINPADIVPIAFCLALVAVTWWRELLRLAAAIAVMLLIIGVVVALGAVGELKEFPSSSPSVCRCINGAVS